MPVRLKGGRHVFMYDFIVAGRRFYGSTGKTTRAEALAVEKDKREAALRGELEWRLGVDAVGAAPLLDAWDAAVDVVASTYGVSPEVVRQQSRGRGPRPPRSTWEARKMAVHLAVILSGRDAAAIGRLIGLHRDTASSHCIDMRDACAESDELERLSLALEYMARLRLKLGATGGKRLRSAA